jgi:NAD(P)-dependent dehydrogenase (short-subunit alcohol dehydrogenase family)
MSGDRRLPVALVTGAAQGIGRAVAIALAGAGYLVAANDRVDSDALRDVVDRTNGIAAVADVADADAVRRAVLDVESVAGTVDVLVANAAYLAMGEVLAQDHEDWWRHIDVNLTGAFNCVSAVVPQMVAGGHGNIVLVSSRWAIAGQAGTSAYSASKAGLVSYGKSLAREIAADGVNVNIIAPGAVNTPQLAVDAAAAGLPLPAFVDAAAHRHPTGRILEPEEVAETVLYLVSPAARATIGQVLQPNGGSMTGTF